MDCKGRYFRVIADLSRAPLCDYLWHGYSDREDFRTAVRHLVRLWHDRTGECIDQRHGFCHLRFHDTPGGMPDEEWLPDYLLQEVEAPRPATAGEPDELEREIDDAFGFE